MIVHVAGRLQDSESLTAWNWEKLSACFEKVVFLSSFELQQLHMFHLVRFLLPSANACVWTGKQLISLLRPVGFDLIFHQVMFAFGMLILFILKGRFGYGTLMVTYFKALEDIAMARCLVSSHAGWNKQIRAMLLLKGLNLFRRIMFFMRDLHGS
ncbi:hypothetical protein OIU77_027153 [Salix suchowensis]|uniref:Uncharacterized protein n=1 Tax=Salix suchowensis TaxID=1278906 RepID=A0ABQ9BNL5_9ROSI|nr:hypothetical protein OIU77_027153 [Salix suchowensis]